MGQPASAIESLVSERGRRVIFRLPAIPDYQLTVTVKVVLAVVAEASFPLAVTVNV